MWASVSGIAAILFSNILLISFYGCKRILEAAVIVTLVNAVLYIGIVIISVHVTGNFK
jgi:hypothetical protein